MSHLVRLTGSVKTPNRALPKREKMIRQSSLFWDVSVGNCGQTEVERKGCGLKFNL